MIFYMLVILELAIGKNLFLMKIPRLTSNYVISLEGAKKLINKLEKIDYPFDELLVKMVNDKEINGYRSSRLVTYQKFQMNKPEKYLIL